MGGWALLRAKPWHSNRHDLVRQWCLHPFHNCTVHFQMSSHCLHLFLRKDTCHLYLYFASWKSCTQHCLQKYFTAGARDRQQLLTIFALSNKYQPSDVALAVSSKLHSSVFQMCQGSLLTIQPCPYQKKQLGNTSQLPVILQVASFRLLQLIAVTTG